MNTKSLNSLVRGTAAAVNGALIPITKRLANIESRMAEGERHAANLDAMRGQLAAASKEIEDLRSGLNVLLWEQRAREQEAVKP